MNVDSLRCIAAKLKFLFIFKFLFSVSNIFKEKCQFTLCAYIIYILIFNFFSRYLLLIENMNTDKQLFSELNIYFYACIV